MTEIFQRTFLVGWQDMDANGHMRNSAYLDAASNVRLMYFAAHGFPVSEFARLRIGPVVLRDVLEYRRELHLLQEISVTLETAGHAEDGSRFRIRNTFYRPDGKLAAVLTTDGAWLDLDRRTLIRPPEALLAAMQAMTRTEEHERLPSILGTSIWP